MINFNELKAGDKLECSNAHFYYEFVRADVNSLVVKPIDRLTGIKFRERTFTDKGVLEKVTLKKETDES